MRSLASIINRWQAIFFLFVFWLAAPRFARAEDNTKNPDAKAYSDLLTRAETAAKSNQIAEAIALWTQAWKLKQHWHLPCNIGEGHFLLQAPDKAATYLTQCLKLAPFPKTEKAAEHRRRIRAMLETTLDHLSVIVITAPQGAKVLVDGEEKGTAPLSEYVFLMPGDHRFIAELNGRIASRSLTTKRREKYTVDLAFSDDKAAPAQPKPAEPKPVQPKPIENKPVEMPRSAPIALKSEPYAWSKRWVPSIALLGSGVLLAGAGVWMRAEANTYAQSTRDLAAAQDRAARLDNSTECAALTAQFHEAQIDFRRMDKASLLTFSAAGVLGAAGLVYPWLPIHGKTPSIAISPSGFFLFGNF